MAITISAQPIGHELYRAELASGRNHSNVVVIETPVMPRHLGHPS